MEFPCVATYGVADSIIYIALGVRVKIMSAGILAIALIPTCSRQDTDIDWLS